MQIGHSGLFHKKPSNKSLRQNLELIFKNQTINSKGANPKAEVKGNLNFKIERSTDKITHAGIVKTEASHYKSTSRLQSKEASRLSNCSGSQSKRATFNANSQELLKKRQIKIVGGEKKTADRPPLPKTIKFSRKSSGASNAAIDTEISTKTIKVNVNIHIT